MKYSISGIAVALHRQHGFDPDIAWLSAHYARQPNKRVVPSRLTMLSLMERVKHVPTLSESEAQQMLNAYTANRGTSAVMQKSR